MAYTASYTAGGILFNEFEAIVPFISKGSIKHFLDDEAKENKYLKITTESARKRVITELKKRIKAVDEDFWNCYQQSTPEEKKLLLFYLCVKTYQLVWDFHFKVTVPGFWAYRHQLDDYAYKMYLDELSSKDEEVNSWSKSTQKKCITNYVRMLNEAGLLNSKLEKPHVDNSFYCCFLKWGQQWALDIYLLTKQEKEVISEYCK